jgi:hypothetical protein
LFRERRNRKRLFLLGVRGMKKQWKGKSQCHLPRMNYRAALASF